MALTKIPYIKLSKYELLGFELNLNFNVHLIVYNLATDCETIHTVCQTSNGMAVVLEILLKTLIFVVILGCCDYKMACKFCQILLDLYPLIWIDLRLTGM